MKVASILDEFSELCFSHEFDLVKLRQDNFVDQINKNPDISFLLVESAWRGSSKSWCLASSYLRKKPEVLNNFEKLIKLCKSKKIPLVFWNKEDPPHYNGFIQVAKYFDYIFTTDVGSKKKYVKDVGHGRIYTLPFAAQPQIHWPHDLLHRYKKPCFAGTYWSRQHKGRALDMNHILAPALKHGLVIFDRNVVTGCGEKWPAVYRNSIKGGLLYSDLLRMYRKYKVFMNVNCVTESLTMFSRRVFEILACGTPVISAYALGIQTLLPTSVCMSTGTKVTASFLNNLLEDDDFWMEMSFRGIREVYAQHTYSHRAQYICKVLGIPFDKVNRLEIYKEVAENTKLTHLDMKNLILNVKT